jgi:crotonobetainyl-CoA:carnitine CoA-transferase CaiB-like acyl-CoA transferase
MRFEVRRDAPDLGQDTDAVLRGVLGLGDDELGRLRAAGVTRTDP